MICIDTNIIIYVSKGDLEPEIFASNIVAYSSVAKIEALGFSRSTMGEQQYLKIFFQEYKHLAVTEAVIQRSIDIRIGNKIDLADAIIAATALENDCVLWTANTDDFKDIDGLKLHNPLEEGSK
ncbi:MAG: type II toxin-antitoxin system VapC family toxin [Patescibacteria group bacterium]